MSDSDKTISNITVNSKKLVGATPSETDKLDFSGNLVPTTPISRGVPHSVGAKPKTSAKVYKPGDERSPMKFALEIRVTLTPSGADPEPPPQHSWSRDLAMDVVNGIYPGCTHMYLGMPGHMVACYGSKVRISPKKMP